MATAIYKVVQPTGPHAPDEIVEVTDADRERGVDVDWLVRIGHLEPYKPAKTEATTPVDVSADPDRNATAIPAVQGDPLRSENPPTLPQAGVSDTTTPA